MSLVDTRDPLNAEPYLRTRWVTNEQRSYYMRSRDGVQASLNGIVGATIHFTGGSPYATVWGVAEYQTGPEPLQNGQPEFPAIAYTYYVSFAGTVFWCHDLATRCWHSGAVVNGIARNASHIGICYAGNVEPNEAQRTGIREAIEHAQGLLGRTLSVEGHKDAYPTRCPGDTWPLWLDAILPAEDVMDELELRAVMGEMRHAWSVQAKAREMIEALMADGSEGAKAVKMAAGSWRKALNWIEAKLGETETS